MKAPSRLDPMAEVRYRMASGSIEVVSASAETERSESAGPFAGSVPNAAVPCRMRETQQTTASRDEADFKMEFLPPVSRRCIDQIRAPENDENAAGLAKKNRAAGAFVPV